MINRIVGKRLLQVRQEKGLSQEKLALLSNVDRTYVPSIEKGRRSVSVQILERLCSALSISLAEFFSSPLFLDHEDD